MVENRKNVSYKEIILILLAVTIISGTFAYLYWNVIMEDDIYITFKYSENLVENGELSFNSGERFEGYSNFLWVIYLATIKYMTSIDFYIIAKLSSLIFFILTAVIFHIILSKYIDKPYRVLATISLALSYATINNIVTSLETNMYIFLILLSTYLLINNVRIKGFIVWPFISLLVALTRSEGIIVLIIQIITLIIIKKINYKKNKKDIYAIIVSFLLFGAYLLVKFGYYGTLITGPALVKQGNIFSDLVQKISYIAYIISQHQILILFGVIAILFLLNNKYKQILIYSILFILAMAVLFPFKFSTGSIRHFSPAIPFIYMLGFIGISYTFKNIKKYKKMIIIIISIILLVNQIFGIYQLNKNINIDKGYLNNGEKIGSYLRTLKCNETLASTDAGAPAFLSKLDFIDLVGLNSEDIAKIYSKERNISKVIDYVENKEPGFIYLNTGNMLTELEKKDFIKEDYSLLDYKFFKERNTESKLYVKKGVRCKNLNINLA